MENYTMEVEHLDFSVILAKLAPLLSILCVVALWTTWCLMPRWRILQHYISVNQITAGALQLCCPWLLVIEHFTLKYEYVLIISDILSLVSISWSLSSSIFAYFKLVLLHHFKISNEKLNISIFVYGLTFSVLIITLVAKNVYNVDYFMQQNFILFVVFIIMTFMIVLFVRIIVSVMSCCRKPILKRNAGHVVSLVGVALICDTGTVLWMFSTHLAFFDNTSSPPPLSPCGRTDDDNAIVSIIESAEQFVYISVMEYEPMCTFTHKLSFWPKIDDAIRKAALENKVKVKLLISWWKHSAPAEDYFLRSLTDLSQAYPRVDLQVKRFVVPSTPEQDKIPYARVNHNKYMVTDRTAYIGTSNWSGDYFITTAGVAFVFQDQAGDGTFQNLTRDIRKDLQEVFERDWNSPYAVPLRRL